MRIARVIGHVVATVRSPHMQMDKLCLVELVNKQGQSNDDTYIAMDQLGAGVGEWVMVVAGSSARRAYGQGQPQDNSPVDLCIVGIIDEVNVAGEQCYLK
ncbi:EutN/CcmL family microcompartment protein [Ferrimonas lipolytica]|uniref:EutN/CcmL family microcompartment protein n=1 Tax=Ferrimonas lipolytica TaxID=2724191 RepID=A0A6H1UAT1_9GAMM|nr:EutN/CcmL family microcompartment protein [Ferrimonas lipolytica]QIZ75700.1 EutN/CcmL family microcompartment protein [Ferrimonas lipolytica]